MNPTSRRTPPLLWMLAGAAVVSGLLLAVLGVWLYRSAATPDTEPLSERWVLQRHHSWNPDARPGTYLARKGATRPVSGKLIASRYVGDDCVIYSAYDYGVYGACGEAEPIYVASYREQAPDLRQDPLVVGTQRFAVAEIKRLAQAGLTQDAGGQWRAQREAFASDWEPREAPRFLLFYAGLRRERFSVPVLAYRYLGDDCLLYVHPPVMLRLVDPEGGGKGFPASARCGTRYEVYLGTVEEPAAISEGDEPMIGGRGTPLTEIVRRAQAEKEHY